MADVLRKTLVSRLVAAGFLQTERVAQAIRLVPRHVFTPPQVKLEEAYRDEAISMVSGLATLSQPSIVALMLERLEVQPGQRVLEIGTASGYNAALLAVLTGAAELVHTVEIDRDLADRAKVNLAGVGFDKVQVITGDGSLGWPAAAPYDRIILTAEVTELSRSLLTQLVEGGVLLAPVAFPQLPALLLRLVRYTAVSWTGGFVGTPVTFVPLRGKYGSDSHKADDQDGESARKAILDAETAAREAGAGLPPARRLALDLVATAFGETGKSGASAWGWFSGAGCPSLDQLRVDVIPKDAHRPAAPAFLGRDFAFLVSAQSERNHVQRGESPSQEGIT